MFERSSIAHSSAVLRRRACALVSSAGLALCAGVLLVAGSARAEFPYPACGACADPADYKTYMFTPTTSPPTRPNEVGQYDFRVSSLVDPSLPNTAEELFGVAGMSIDRAWQLTTGRPDVIVAVLDSGIRYDNDNVNKAALNAGELPLPEGSADHDANDDAIFNIRDYLTDSRVSDMDGNGRIDPRDLILIFSDGSDDDANGYVDDICGWDTHEHDNDPFDDADYGHGTGESKDSSGEVNNGGAWGAAPNTMFLPIKVSDSFVADGNDFGAAVAFAVDAGASIISEALGGLNNTSLAQNAVEYAYRRGIPLVLSAADEQSYHHNFPAVYNHGFWAHSVRGEDGLLVTDPTNLLFNGCTNYGGRAQVAIASNSCSSEATGLAAGIFALFTAHAKNQVERGEITVHPVTGTPLSPTEIYQLLMMTADDIDFSAVDRTLHPDPLLLLLLPNLFSERFPSQPGYDKYFGYGRANVRAAIEAIDAGTIPPEADIVEPVWFDNVDPTVTPTLNITGTAAAWRNANNAGYTVTWACGIDPAEAEFVAPGHVIASSALGGTPIEDDLLATLDTTTISAACGFGSITLPRTDEDDFDETYAITIRVTVEDSLGNLAQARRNVTVYHDAGLLPGFPLPLEVSGESAPVLHDMNGDGAQEIILATADGGIHVLDSTGSELPGWPAHTSLMDLEDGASFALGALGSNYRSAITAALAVGDIDDDGDDEIVAADLDGSVYAFTTGGVAMPGFPVTLDPVFSAPALRNEANRLDFGIIAAPTLADLDGDGTLEIIVAAMDRHLYVWNADGTSQAGFPVLIVDQERMSSVNPVHHQVTWKLSGGQPVGSIGTKLIGSPSVGDIDGDGDLEIIVGSNEEYVRDEEANFALNTFLWNQLKSSLDLPNGRIYALSHLGNLDPAVTGNPSGPFLAGWPVRIGMLIADLLPTVGHGVNASAMLADVDDDGDDEVFINGSTGPAYILQGDGKSFFGSFAGDYRVLSPQVSATDNPDAGSTDFPLTFGLLGSGAGGDFFGDGGIDFALPSLGTTQLLDTQGPAHQGPSDHQIMAWSSDGKGLPAFPQIMEDIQFLTSPIIADVNADGVSEVLEGSGGYYLHAFSADGGEPATWPKFTGGWTIGSMAAGDIDDDGSMDVVAMTREGRLYAWSTPALYDGPGAKTVQWATLARDRHRSGNLNSGVATSAGADGCTKEYRPVIEKIVLKQPAGADNDKVMVKGFANLTGAMLDPTSGVGVTIGGPVSAGLDVQIPGAGFKANAQGTKFSYSGAAPGVTKIKLLLKNGRWRFLVKASGVSVAPSDERVLVRLEVGGVCLERSRTCVPNGSGTTLKCGKPEAE